MRCCEARAARGAGELSPPVVAMPPARPRPAPPSVGHGCCRRGDTALAVGPGSRSGRVSCSVPSVALGPGQPCPSSLTPAAAVGLQSALRLHGFSSVKTWVGGFVRVSQSGAAPRSGLPVSMGIHGLQWQVTSSCCVYRRNALHLIDCFCGNSGLSAFGAFNSCPLNVFLSFLFINPQQGLSKELVCCMWFATMFSGLRSQHLV